MTPKIKFVLDRSCDEKCVHHMLTTNDPSGNWNRAKTMGLSRKEFETIRKIKNYKDAREIINKISEPRYKKLGKKLKLRQKKYQKDWNKISTFFFKEVEKITGYKWEHKKYEVVLSVFHRGLTFERKDWVVRWIETLPKQHRRITAHEILMTHIWRVLHLKVGKKIYASKLWGLNEITTVAILGLEPSLNKLWQKPRKGYDSFLSNYPQLKKMQQTLKEIYLNKRDFKDYLTKALKQIR